MRATLTTPVHCPCVLPLCAVPVCLCLCVFQVAVPSLTMGSCSSLQGIELSSKTVVVLDVRGCGGLQQLHLDCPALQVLDANFCATLGDEGLSAAVASIPPLRKLALSVCTQVGRVVSLLRLLLHGYRMELTTSHTKFQQGSAYEDTSMMCGTEGVLGSWPAVRFYRRAASSCFGRSGVVLTSSHGLTCQLTARNTDTHQRVVLYGQECQHQPASGFLLLWHI